MARATDRQAAGHAALIVAYGSPSHPEVQEKAMQVLAARVGLHLPGWHVRGCTLAAEERLGEQVREMRRPIIFPFFMARGHFTGKVLREKTCMLDLPQLEPFGTLPALVSLAANTICEVISGQGWQAGSTKVLIAAHGSRVSRTSADTAYSFAAKLKAEAGFLDCICGFIEEAPFLEATACNLEQAICLPFFAMEAGHVVEDVPEALLRSGFSGPVLEPFINWQQTPNLIARALLSGQLKAGTDDWKTA